MADKKISALTGASTPLAGTEVLPIVQGGSTVKATIANIVGAGTSPGSFTNITGSANAIISVTDNTNAALRITQLGTGNALLVEDTTNPDASPFVIDASGNVIVGGTTPITGSSSFVPPLQVSTGNTNSSGVGVNSFSAGSGNGFLHFNRSKSNTVGTNTVVTSGDVIGNIVFAGADGTGFIRAASILTAVDGTPGTNDMPGRLVFSTTADGASSTTERMRIDSAGNVTLSTGNLIVSTTGKGVTTGSAIPLGFGTNNGTTTMTVATDGSVGIGTTTPDASLQIYSSYPVLSMEESDAAANNKKWWFEINGGVYQGRILNDAISAASTWIKVTRSGTTVSSIEFPSGPVTMGNYGVGTATFSATGLISSVSDETYKIKDGVIADPIPMIMALETGYYYGKPEANMGTGRQLGFYAQNVRTAIGPEAAPDPETYTVTDENGVDTIKTKPWGYYDRSVLAVAIEAIKVQQAQITALTARIAALEAKCP